MKSIRKVSSNERMYLCEQELFSTITIQFLVEGRGNISVEKLKKAVEEVGEKFPETRSRYKKGEWVDSGIPPKVEVVNGSKFDGYSFDKLEYIEDKLGSSGNEEVAKVIVLMGENPRIIFKIFHGVMDGQGITRWVRNIFKALRGEEVEESLSFETDTTAAKKLGAKKLEKLPKLNKVIRKDKIEQEDTISVKRKSISGRHQGVVAKIAKVLTNNFLDEENVFMIPTDIRRHDKRMNSTANMTLPIFLSTKKGESWEEINKKLIENLRNNEELNLRNVEFKAIPYLPIKVLKFAIKNVVSLCNRIDKYMVGGIISFLGSLKMEEFSCEGFEAKTIHTIPILMPLVPVAFVICQNDTALEVILNYKQDLVDSKLADKILSEIEEELINKSRYENLNKNSNLDYQNVNIGELYRSSFDKYKKNIAIKEEGKVITYSELEKRADNLLEKLKKEGVTNEIMLFLDRSTEFIISVIACIKGGISFAPIDELNPVTKQLLEKYEYILTDTEKEIRDYSKTIIVYDDSGNSVRNWSEKTTKIYEVYTSGTTGQPKKVGINNENLVNYLTWAKKEYKIEEKDCFAFFTSTAVDLSITSYLLPLLCGASIQVYKEKFNTVIAKKLVVDNDITCLKMTPTHLNLIESLVKKEQGDKKLLILGGELLTKKTAEIGKVYFGENCRIINEYGPTETTIGTIYHEYDGKDEIVPIGRPIQNTKILILDEEMRRVPVGKTGEIYIGGMSVFNGYKDKSGLVNIEGDNYYKTGDLAYLNENDYYVYKGRKDRQVKINGRRIELSDVESKIRNIEEVEEIILEVEKNLIIGYYKGNIEAEELFSKLRKEIANYMLPKYLTKLEVFPLGKTGKVDITQLKQEKNFKQPTPSSVNYSSEEEKILRLYAQILEIDTEEIKLTDEFIELGGDSLGYIDLIDRLIEEYGIEEEKAFIKEMDGQYGNLKIQDVLRTAKKYI